jgi:hypothetical protein
MQAMTVYQINDGPANAPLDRFGIRRFQSGELKPSAHVPRLAAPRIS